MDAIDPFVFFRMRSLTDLDENLMITGRVLSPSDPVGDVSVKLQVVTQVWSDGSADFPSRVV